MKGCRLLCVVAILAVVGFAPAPLPKRERAISRDDLETMQGLWKMTRQESSGTPTPHNFEARIKGRRWTFINVNGNNKADGNGYFLWRPRRT